MELQVGVKILLENREGKYLVIFRSAKRVPKDLVQWDIPGGRIHPGTPLLENLQREVMEETGLKIKGKPELIAAQDILKTDRHIVRITYIGFADGEVKLSEEHSQYKWLSLEEIFNIEPIDEYFKEVLATFILE